MSGLDARLREIYAAPPAPDAPERWATYAAVTRQVRAFESRARARHHELAIDEPTSVGGGDVAPNPAELALCALGASIEVTARAWAVWLDVPLDGVGVRLSGRLDELAFFDLAGDARTGLQDVEVAIDLRTPPSISAEQRAALLERVQRCCPLLDTFRSGTSLRVVVDEPGSEGSDAA